MSEWIMPILKGAAIAIFLASMNWNTKEFRWWVAMLSLNVMVNI